MVRGLTGYAVPDTGLLPIVSFDANSFRFRDPSAVFCPLREILARLYQATWHAKAESYLSKAESYLYWLNSGSIGRVGIDGSNAEAAWFSGYSNPIGVAVDENFVYWTNYTTAGNIGRARLDGSDFDNLPRRYRRDGLCGVAAGSFCPSCRARAFCVPDGLHGPFLPHGAVRKLE